MQKDAAGSGEEYQFQILQWKSCRIISICFALPAAVLYFRYDQDHESGILQPRCSFVASGAAEKRTVGGYTVNRLIVLDQASDGAVSRYLPYRRPEGKRRENSEHKGPVQKRLFCGKGEEDVTVSSAQVRRYGKTEYPAQSDNEKLIVRQSVT